MRLLPFLLLALAAAAPARATPPSASAQLYAERVALLAGDRQCHLLAPDARSALEATSTQARFGALRAGWTGPALDGVASRAAQAGRARACTDPLLISAAKSATAGYRGWAKMPKMQFPGVARMWAVRRAPDGDGWMLTQDLSAGAKFGIAANLDGKTQLVLSLPEPNGAAPSSASLYFRDSARAPRALLDVPGMTTKPGLDGGLAPRSLTATRFASSRIDYRPKDAPARIVFTFPTAVLAEIAALDPRESVEIEVNSGAGPARYLLEVGDLAAARAFLAARA